MEVEGLSFDISPEQWADFFVSYFGYSVIHKLFCGLGVNHKSNILCN